MLVKSHIAEEIQRARYLLRELPVSLAIANPIKLILN